MPLDPVFTMLPQYVAPLLLVEAVLLALLVGIVIWLAIRLRRAEKGYRTLTAGTSAGNLEAILEDHMVQLRQAVERMNELDRLTGQLEQAARSYIQHMGVLRFNPFRDSGGDQSFAVALGDQDGQGVVISGLHGRDGTRVYAKPLAGWESAYPLTDEERQAIQQARGDY
jgi:hypothetical protein